MALSSSPEVAFPFSPAMFWAPPALLVFWQLTQRETGYNCTTDMHSVTEIKEVAHTYSLINVFFPLCNKEGNCKFVIRQVSKFSKNDWVIFFPPLS